MIREVRQRAGLSQRQMSRLTGITESRISDYENGRHQPSASMLQRLVEAAGHDLVAVPRASGPAPLDPKRNGRILADLLSFVDAVPFADLRREGDDIGRTPATWAQLVGAGPDR